MKRETLFWSGFRAMIPITTGVLPFGAVMGVVSSEAKLSLYQTIMMNIIVFAGASQLAALELMTKHAASVVVILTGLIINLRFLLYSAAISPIVQKSSALTKFYCSYIVTDQNYAVMSANQDRLKTNSEAIQFYLGSSVCMLLAWHISVLGGFVFGNFAPAAWSLEFAVPLSFVALVVPTIKNRTYVVVAAFSSVTSLLLHALPFKTGLIFTALLSIALAFRLTQRKASP